LQNVIKIVQCIASNSSVKHMIHHFVDPWWSIGNMYTIYSTTQVWKLYNTKKRRILEEELCCKI